MMDDSEKKKNKSRRGEGDDEYIKNDEIKRERQTG